MQEVAFDIVLLFGVAAFCVVPSAFIFRHLWRAQGAKRFVGSTLGLLLAVVAAGFSLSSPLALSAQWEAWFAFFVFWLLLMFLTAPALLSMHLLLRVIHRRPKADARSNKCVS